MNKNATAIAVFCSHLAAGEGVKPFEPAEWSKLAKLLSDRGMQPSELLAFSPEDFRSKLDFSREDAERALRLTDRGGSLAFELGKYENMGIRIVTRADEDYPSKLKKALGNACPPLFYCAGDLKNLDGMAAGYVGSRTVGEEDIAFTKNAVRKTVSRGFAVVSGGAKGVDLTAEEEALGLGGAAVCYLADSMLRKLRSGAAIHAIADGKLAVLSVAKPDAGFTAGIAMMRNRYIYAQSEGTVVVKSDYNKGGTWAGASDSLKHSRCRLFCWNKSGYAGNEALIRLGAIPIDESWDGDVLANGPVKIAEQMTFLE